MAHLVRTSLAVLLSGAMVVACAVGGISRDKAIEVALGNAEGSATVVSVESGPIGRFTDMTALPGEPADRQVWAVLLNGNFEGECVLGAGGQSVCPPGATGKLVVLDFKTGELILSESR